MVQQVDKDGNGNAETGGYVGSIGQAVKNNKTKTIIGIAFALALLVYFTQFS